MCAHRGGRGSEVSLYLLKAGDVLLLTQLTRVYERCFDLEQAPERPAAELENLLTAQCGFLVAIADGQVVGGLTFYRLPMIRGGEELYLYDLGVDPAWRRRSIATRLLEELRAFAQTEGCQCVYVQAEAEDEQAVAFYRSLNWEEGPVCSFSAPGFSREGVRQNDPAGYHGAAAPGRR